jgi:hypothetical protein
MASVYPVTGVPRAVLFHHANLIVDEVEVTQRPVAGATGTVAGTAVR